MAYVTTLSFGIVLGKINSIVFVPLYREFSYANLPHSLLRALAQISAFSPLRRVSIDSLVPSGR